jgi:hypothetical protein
MTYAIVTLAADDLIFVKLSRRSATGQVRADRPSGGKTAC